MRVIDPTLQKIEGISETGKHKQEFKELLKKKEFARIKELFWPILRRDLRSVDESHVLIWYYNPEEATVGTIHEVVVCSHIERKPILMYVPEDKIGQISPWALTFIKPSWLFTSWKDMEEYLDRVNKKQFDSSKWIF